MVKYRSKVANHLLCYCCRCCLYILKLNLPIVCLYAARPQSIAIINLWTLCIHSSVGCMRGICHTDDDHAGDDDDGDDDHDDDDDGYHTHARAQTLGKKRSTSLEMMTMCSNTHTHRHEKSKRRATGGKIKAGIHSSQRYRFIISRSFILFRIRVHNTSTNNAQYWADGS